MSLSQGTLRPLAHDEAKAFEWTRLSRVATVVGALEAARPYAARFVGGCVRDGLVGVAAKDIDIATQLRPDEVVVALTDAGIRAEPTGIEHGTITAVVGGEGIEVTSLRADVATDGRRAVVSYTEDWTLDAVRRDFTINAMYLTPDLRLFDPWNGFDDLRAGRVRFIGDAETRIREDYLRILRFFRFSARFSPRAHDMPGLQACAALAEGIRKLSRERVGQEFFRIMEGPDASGALIAMRDAGVLDRIWKEEADIAAFGGLASRTASLAAPVGLAALWPASPNDGRGTGRDELAAALRLSNADASRRCAASKACAELEATARGAANRRIVIALAYRRGVQAARDGLALAAARGGIQIDQGTENALDGWAPPVLPIAGADILAMGIPPGPAIGALLERVESRWVAENFPDGARVRTILAEEIARDA